jgi:hypothetical protein
VKIIKSDFLTGCYNVTPKGLGVGADKLFLAQTVDRHINADAEADKVDNQAESDGWYIAERENINRIAYDNRYAPHHRQPGASLAIDGKAGHLADGIAGAGCQQQIEINERHQICDESLGKTGDNRHAQRRTGCPEVVSRGDTVSGQFIESGAFAAPGPHRGLHYASGAYRFAALATPEIRCHVRVSGAFHCFRRGHAVFPFLAGCFR